MSDIYLKSSQGTPDIVIINGVPQLTDGLDNAVYLSLFQPAWWGNNIAGTDEKYESQLPDIIAEGVLTNQTRLDVIEEAKNALKWMIDKGIAIEITSRAEISAVGRLDLAVTITEPNSIDPLDFKYNINWDTQEITIQEGTW